MLLVGGSCFCSQEKNSAERRSPKKEVRFKLSNRRVFRYPNTASPQKVGPGPGHHPGLPVQVNWNA